uniref:Uncharacterized protein n=1 Tax=Chromera velia CCMP2878 TaxID=1169474 RepID=A0A0G4F7Q6_9ALVE|eukprot:Cvel_15594.t1-p1 / transcript=Cvel_15594.t1 / gene=Cvel_15594 / organism=Chromera_velia_CCMP2878 / gene_product=Ropporin-1-like protein, putative / transcript_product=Ropporin-1-like protein, putative / location=Cvel_scaffold1160:4887-5843(-) / protein_length=75 / sequence_SO=supercontig / SO=protein_coding / is_pseudo=false
MTDITMERIFCAEQINVPPTLPVILKEYTKEVIRRDPTEGETNLDAAKLKIYEWSANWFRHRAGRSEKEGDSQSS